MIFGVFAVRDRASDCFGAPFVMQSDGMAIREFQQMAKDSNHAFGKWPTDFSLYKVGHFDDHRGSLESLKEPLFLCSADGIVGGGV